MYSVVLFTRVHKVEKYYTIVVRNIKMETEKEGKRKKKKKKRKEKETRVENEFFPRYNMYTGRTRRKEMCYCQR